MGCILIGCLILEKLGWTELSLLTIEIRYVRCSYKFVANQYIFSEVFTVPYSLYAFNILYGIICIDKERGYAKLFYNINPFFIIRLQTYWYLHTHILKMLQQGVLVWNLDSKTITTAVRTIIISCPLSVIVDQTKQSLVNISNVLTIIY